MAEFASDTKVIHEEALLRRFMEQADDLMLVLAAMPVSRETNLAKTKLEECTMWATWATWAEVSKPLKQGAR